MNTLPSNRDGQAKQSKSRRLANHLNNNVTNLKNKLTSNLVKRCRFNRKSNQETSFIDCEATNLNATNRNSLTTRHTMSEWSNFDDQKSIKDENRNLSGQQECTQCIQPANCPTFDHNRNYDKNSENLNGNHTNRNANEKFQDKPEVVEKIDSFDAKFEDVNFDGYTIGEYDKNKNVINLLKDEVDQTDQNNKIINEFLLYTNKLASDSNLTSTNQSSSASPPNASSNADQMLDVSALAYSESSNRNQSTACILEDDERQQQSARLSKNQSNTNRNINIPNNPMHQPRVVLRRHMRKEAMDVKSARKQVSFLKILNLYIFFCIEK